MNGTAVAAALFLYARLYLITDRPTAHSSDEWPRSDLYAVFGLNNHLDFNNGAHVSFII